MLNEEQIEDILYQYVKRQDEFNRFVVSVIASRLSRIADFDSLSTLDKLSVMSKDISTIDKEYVAYEKEQKKRIHDDLWMLVAYLYEEAAIYYTVFRSLDSNRELVTATEKAIKKAQESFAKLTKNPVFVMRDLKNPAQIKPYDLEDAYRTTINEAVSYSTLTDEMRDIALKRTETQLFDGGIRYLTDESSDDTTSANRAVRANILESVMDFMGNTQDIMGRQFGADGVQMSAHLYPAPDHAPAQGHRYTRENIDKMQSASDFEDVDGNRYVGFERQVMTCNCRHYFMNIKLDSPPIYTQDELDKILADNERGYTTPDGRHYTLYECTQIQRRYERRIRSAKESYLYAKALGDKNKMVSSKTRVGDLTSQYKQFSSACGIPIKTDRIKVKNYQNY